MGREFETTPDSDTVPELIDDLIDDDDQSLHTTQDSEDWWKNTETIRAKWMYDGCETIDEIIIRLHEEIAKFLSLKSQGWELIDKIEDDYGHMRRVD